MRADRIDGSEGGRRGSSTERLQRRLESDNPDNRARAITVLLEREGKSIVPFLETLRNLLPQEDNPSRKEQIIQIIGSAGPHAIEAIPELVDCLVDADRDVVHAAEEQIGKIFKGAPENTGNELRGALAQADRETGLKVLQILERNLSDTNARVLGEARVMLTQIAEGSNTRLKQRATEILAAHPLPVRE